MARNGCGQSGHRTLKLAVSQEWIDGMNWFFACWCKFKKAKSYFNDFWVGQVKNGCCHLVHETLKSVEWVYGLSWYFACWLWCSNFLLDQHCTFYFWLLNFSLLELYLLAPWWQLERSYEGLSIIPSLHLPECFLKILIIWFLWILPGC